MKVEKNSSPITIAIYRSELERLSGFLETIGISDSNKISISTLREFIYKAREVRKLAPVSIGVRIG